jgi:DNA-binding CsgD family transcriptional regulator
VRRHANGGDDVNFETTSTQPPTPAPVPAAVALTSLKRASQTGVLPLMPAGPTSVPPRRVLNDREKQVLRLVCEGMSNAEIALRLGVSRDAIKNELKRIFHKISVKNRTQAAVLVVSRSML